MSVTILLITHDKMGIDLLKVLKNTYDKLPNDIEAISIDRNSDPEKWIAKIIKAVHKIRQHEGVLLLTDLYGSTPSNIAYAVKAKIADRKIEVVAGVNLPMLLKIVNYYQLPLEQLTDKAIQGGRQGIVK